MGTSGVPATSTRPTSRNRSIRRSRSTPSSSEPARPRAGHTRGWICAIALQAALATTALAASSPAAWHLSIDNDYFNFWDKPHDRPDFGYTHGTQLVIHAPAVPRLLARVAPPSLRPDASHPDPRFVLAIRQAIYVPWRRSGDRPYAGWLELGLGVRTESAARVREGRLRLGVTGPPSLAERTQNLIHRGFGFDRSIGWSRQLPFEPGFALEYGGSDRLAAIGRRERIHWETAASWRARLGTFATDLRGGIESTLGFDPPAPWRESAHVPRGDALYLIGAVTVDAIARDEFLDGTFFRGSPSADKFSVVPQAEAGVGFQFRSLRLEYRVVRRAREFDRQPTPHTYSTLAVGWAPDRGAPR